MKGTPDAAFELNKFIKYSMALNLWKKNKHSPKSEGAFNRFREDTVPGKSGDRTLCSNYWTIKGASLLAICGVSFKSCEMKF